MYVFAIFPSPRVNFAFRSPSGGDSAGPLHKIKILKRGMLIKKKLRKKKK